MLFDSQPSPRSQGFSAPMRVAVEAGDREPCVGGVSGASAGKKSAPPFLLSSWLRFRKVFFSQCQSRSAGEGGKEDRRASRRWGKLGSRTRAVSTALETGQRTQPATSCGNPAGLAGEQSHHSILLPCPLLLCGTRGISRTGSPHRLSRAQNSEAGVLACPL